MSKDDKEIVAYHEAGHTIAAYALGWSIYEATATETDKGAGYVELDYWDNRWFPKLNRAMERVEKGLPLSKPSRELAVAYMVFGSAGMIAERLYRGYVAQRKKNCIGVSDEFTSLRSDNARLWATASCLYSGDAERNALLITVEEKAERIITDQWDSVVLVAAALTSESYLCSWEIAELLGKSGLLTVSRTN